MSHANIENAMLILVLGLPGSGKTTFAKAFAERKNAVHLNSDLLRRELGEMGKYSPEDKQKVYETLLERARQALAAGKTVVVDSTFYKEKIREPFRKLAAECRRPLRWVEILANETTIEARLKKPRPDSEADFGVYQKIKSEAEPLEEPHLVLKSDEVSLGEMIEACLEFTSEKTK